MEFGSFFSPSANGNGLAILGENSFVLLGFLTCLKVLLIYLKKVLPVKK